MLIETMYNKVAINTGFPSYVDETSTPETTRFLLEMLNQALLNVIDNIYISNNVLEKRNAITTKAGQDHYAVDGMVKSIQYLQGQNKLSGKYIPFNFAVDEPGIILPKTKYGAPMSYVVDRGDVRFFPTPDKSYQIRITTSTTDLVWANDDSSRNSIEDIKDSLMASNEFCELVILKACSYVLARCNNIVAEFYSKLYSERVKTFIERDSHSFEQPHLYNPRKGHYEPRRGLLD